MWVKLGKVGLIGFGLVKFFKVGSSGRLCEKLAESYDEMLG